MPASPGTPQLHDGRIRRRKYTLQFISTRANQYSGCYWPLLARHRYIGIKIGYEKMFVVKDTVQTKRFNVVVHRAVLSFRPVKVHCESVKYSAPITCYTDTNTAY